MGALHIICDDLEVGLHIHCCAGHQQQAAAQLLGICLLCKLLNLDIPIKHAAPG